MHNALLNELSGGIHENEIEDKITSITKLYSSESQTGITDVLNYIVENRFEFNSRLAEYRNMKHKMDSLTEENKENQIQFNQKLDVKEKNLNILPLKTVN